MLRPREVLAMTVEELVAWKPGAPAAMGRFGIDLCRCYHLSLRSAALVHGADPHEVAGVLLTLQTDARAAEALVRA